MRGGRLAVAIAASAATILSAPYIDVARAAVRSAFPQRFAAVVTAALVLTLVAICATALTRIRDRRLPRSLAIALAVAIGAVYARFVSTGQPEVDAVERVHFIEYGVIGLLFYRVWRDRGDWSIVVLPLIAGWLVGTLDEFLQWYVPVRVGEVHDVLINVVASGCGLLFGIGLEPPAFPLAPRRPASAALACSGAAVTLTVFALFINAVHLGYEIRDGEGDVFPSRFTAGELMAAAADRAARWRTNPPLVLARLSREDQYLSEARFHIQARNQLWAQGRARAAWRENRILEEFYAPVLASPLYFTATPPQWPDALRAQAAATAQGWAGPYVSAAYPFPLFLWPRAVFWLLVALAAVALVAAGRRAERKSRVY